MTLCGQSSVCTVRVGRLGSEATSNTSIVLAKCLAIATESGSVLSNAAPAHPGTNHALRDDDEDDDADDDEDPIGARHGLRSIIRPSRDASSADTSQSDPSRLTNEIVHLPCESTDATRTSPGPSRSPTPRGSYMARD